jgi:5-methyltetrahydropteroyltriglutamate--homocysteine methyltransferase
MAKDRILATHAGALPRSGDLRDLVIARSEGKPHDQAALARSLREEVAAVVKKQVECGIDSVNDGELSKNNFTYYVRERMGGLEIRTYAPGEGPTPLSITARDARLFPAYFGGRQGAFGRRAFNVSQAACVAPLKYAGQAALKADIENFRAALEKMKGGNLHVEEAFLPANTPGTIEHWLKNDHYKSAEEFLFAIADAMHEEYKGIVDAGFLLQIDDPDLPDGWQMFPDMSVADYRKYAKLRVEALNHALRDIPRETIRLHVCWGSFHGPHQADIPLKDIADIIFSVRASSYSIEASNPVHEHEWHVFEEVKIPEGAVLIPGVVGHCTDFIEHPQAVADRLIRYANLVGKENVMAGTDCGLGHRVGHPDICWAKLESLAEGARLATKQLWGRK